MLTRAIAENVAANKSRIEGLEDALAAETNARLQADALMLQMRDVTIDCLERLAASKDIADVNITAGEMLQRLEHETPKPAPTIVIRDGFVTKGAFALWVAIALVVGTLVPATYLWDLIL